MAEDLYLDTADADAAFLAWIESVEYVPSKYKPGDMPTVADDDDEETEGVSKHLKGQHDQSRHASGAVTISDLDEVDAALSELSQAKIARVDAALGDGLGVSYRVTEGPPGQSQAIKRANAADIADRLSDVPTRDLAAAAGLESDRVERILTDPRPVFLDARSGMVFSTGGPPRQPLGVRGGSPEAEQLLRIEAVSTLQSNWAKSSNDNNALALAVQEGARREFGIDDAADWPDVDAQSGAARLLEQHGPVYQRYARVQYEAAQEALAGAGVTHMRLYRGVEGTLLPTGDVSVSLRPASSFSLRREVADSFADTPWSGKKGQVIEAIVPASRVLSTWATGSGCWKEWELVVLGGVMDATVSNQAPAVKHLKGQHDQSRHASGGPPKVASEREANRAIYAAAEARLGYGPGKEDRPAVKAAIAADIADRLSDVPARDLANAAGLDKSLVDAAMDPDSGYMISVRPGGLDISRSGPGAPAGSPEAEQLVRQAAVGNMVDLWAATSNDSNPRALAIQQSAQREFGIDDAAEWPANRATRAVVASAADMARVHGPVYRRYVRAQYDATQEAFADTGITHVRLYRGTSQPELPLEGSATVALRPLSSFSTSGSVATGFGSHSGGRIISADVPVSRIVSTWATGVGCLTEAEVVVIGGVMDAQVRPWAPTV